tara:strand:- start:912 stop:1085 length:174 start_codon:yes stop_codon:yes gene_type:complete
MGHYEVVIEGDNGLFQDMIEAKNKTELLVLLKQKYPEDVGADAYGYDPDGEEFGIDW